MASINDIIKSFEITEANLTRLKKILAQNADDFSENRRRAALEIWEALPSINGQKPPLELYSPDEASMMQFQAREVGVPEYEFEILGKINGELEPVEEYEFLLKRHRLQVVRKRAQDQIRIIDEAVAKVGSLIPTLENNDEIHCVDEHIVITEAVNQLDTLLGTTLPKPPRWTDLRRHLHFWQLGDMVDIVENDWPAVYPVLSEGLYAEDEPIPVPVSDLSELIDDVPESTVTTELAWSNIDADGFERVIFNLIQGVDGYQNPQWFAHTNAPDGGRDLSVERVIIDPLSGTRTERVIIQCKHYQKTSIAVKDLGEIIAQMKLWGNPPVSSVIIATSGRLSKDAIQWIEKHNAEQQSPRIEPWPNSHIESLLTKRPDIISQFKLR